MSELQSIRSLVASESPSHSPYALVKNYLHINLKIHNSCNFFSYSIKFQAFINISLLHVLGRNKVSW